MEQEIQEIKNSISKEPELSSFKDQPAAIRPSFWQLFGAGFVLSGCSPSFYYHASRKRLITAVLFFVFFGFILASILTLRVGREMQHVREDIESAFSEGKFPEITIEDGTVSIHGPEPFIVVDDGRNLVVLDTTGQYSGEELDNDRYESGVILTKTKLYTLDDQGELQIVNLNNPFFQPRQISINARIGQLLVSGIQASVLLGSLIWFVAFGLFYIVLLAFGVWGVAAIAQKTISFSSILITGLFAVVPATYAHYLIDRAEFDFFGMFTLLLLAGWSISLVAAVGKRQPGDFLRGQRPLRAWRALIGLPMLVVLVLDAIYQWPNGAAITWLTAVLTFFVLFTLELLAPRFEFEGQPATTKIS